MFSYTKNTETPEEDICGHLQSPGQSETAKIKNTPQTPQKRKSYLMGSQVYSTWMLSVSSGVLFP